MKAKQEELPMLNQTEETVMQAIWNVKQGFVGEIIQCLPDPKPPYNTVVTTIRNLEKKGYLHHETFAKANRYTPAVDRNTYVGRSISTLVKNYFNSSYNSMLSFFVEDQVVGKEELEQALELIRQREEQEGGRQ